MTALTYDPNVHLRLSSVKAPYKDSTGKRVPGVTTVLSSLGKDALLDWAAKLEREAVLRYVDEAADTCETPASVANATRTLVRHFLGDRYAHSISRQASADVGSVGHGRIAAWLTGRTLWEEGLPPAALAQSLDILERFQSWYDAHGFVCVVSELAIVNDEWGVGGTLDYVGRDKEGRVVLLDFKTSNASAWWPYDETFAQVATYEALWGRARQPAVDRVLAVRVGREKGSAVQEREVSVNERAAGLALFEGALAVHKAKNALARARRSTKKGGR